ncbi:MAG: SGNH/GDSL hydrolase family protein [Pedobacter sp.]|nr:MAG: SGNH/GDSL hydrolase family protein [Pedobacter sp.]
MKRKVSLTVFATIAIFCLSSFNTKKILWVAIGDSITYLNDHLDETGNRVSKGYMTRVKEKLPDIDFVNQGHNGWTVVGIAREIEKLGLVKAEVYSVFLGTNDWWSGIPLGTLDDYKGNTGTATMCGAYRLIINKVKALNPSAKVILVTPMQRSDFVYLSNFKNNAWGSYREKNNQSLEAFAKAIAAIAKYDGFRLVDLYHDEKLKVKDLVSFKRLKKPGTSVYQNFKYPNYVDVPFDPSIDEYPYPPEAVGMTYDGLHPSDKGYERIATAFLRHLK